MLRLRSPFDSAQGEVDVRSAGLLTYEEPMHMSFPRRRESIRASLAQNLDSGFRQNDGEDAVADAGRIARILPYDLSHPSLRGRALRVTAAISSCLHTSTSLSMTLRTIAACSHSPLGRGGPPKAGRGGFHVEETHPKSPLKEGTSLSPPNI